MYRYYGNVYMVVSRRRGIYSTSLFLACELVIQVRRALRICCLRHARWTSRNYQLAASSWQRFKTFRSAISNVKSSPRCLVKTPEKARLLRIRSHQLEAGLMAHQISHQLGSHQSRRQMVVDQPAVEHEQPNRYRLRNRPNLAPDSAVPVASARPDG